VKERLADKLLITAQEDVQGAAHAMRLDLYKKLATADPVAARMPYAVVTRLGENYGRPLLPPHIYVLYSMAAPRHMYLCIVVPDGETGAIY